MEMEQVDAILYYLGQKSDESIKLIKRGAEYFSKLNLMMVNETSEQKALYYEKILTRINANNADFRTRLAW